MKRALFLFALCAGLALAFVTVSTDAAADVTGSWSAEMQTPDGNTMQLSFTFKQDGEKLTGTVATSMGGDPIEISNGKIDGDKITFDTSFNGMTISHEGTISGDEIKLKAQSDSGQMPPMEMTLKRAK